MMAFLLSDRCTIFELKVKLKMMFDEHFNEHSEQARASHTNRSRDVPRYGALSLLNKSLKTRFNTNPSGTEANATGRSVRACVARESKREES
jgi:hypothetical protein